MAIGITTCAGGEDRERTREAVQELLGSEHAEPRRGHLERERNALEQGDDARSDHPFFRGEDRAHRPRSLLEELHRVGRRAGLGREGERADAVHDLARRAEPDTRGREDDERRGVGDPAHEQRKRSLFELLEVVEREEAGAAPRQRPSDPFDCDGRRAGRAERDPRGRCRDAGDHVRRGARAREIAPQRALVGDAELPREPVEQPRLADATRSEERDEARPVSDEPFDRFEVGVTPDEASAERLDVPHGGSVGDLSPGERVRSPSER